MRIIPFLFSGASLKGEISLVRLRYADAQRHLTGEKSENTVNQQQILSRCRLQSKLKCLKRPFFGLS